MGKLGLYRAARCDPAPNLHLKVNNPIEVTLTTLYAGTCHTVVTLGITPKNEDEHGAKDEDKSKDEAREFIDRLQSNEQGRKKLLNKVRMASSQKICQNENIIKNLGDGLFEFHPHTGLRLYAFYAQISAHESSLIIAACGGGKGQKKQQAADIMHARELKTLFESINADPNATIRILEL